MAVMLEISMSLDGFVAGLLLSSTPTPEFGLAIECSPMGGRPK